MERRNFLSSLLTVGSVAIAGCSGGNENSRSGSKRAVEQYLSAKYDGNTTKANKFLHPKAINYPLERATVSGSTVVGVEEITTNQVVELERVNKEEVEDIKDNVRAKTGAEEVQFVKSEILREDDDTVDRVLLSVKVENEWRVWVL